MILAAICGTLILVGFISFFINIVMSVGLKGVVGIFTPAKIKTTDLIPAK
jgi:cytochrome c oxidase subunit 1